MGLHLHRFVWICVYRSRLGVGRLGLIDFLLQESYATNIGFRGFSSRIVCNLWVAEFLKEDGQEEFEFDFEFEFLILIWEF